MLNFTGKKIATHLTFSLFFVLLLHLLSQMEFDITDRHTDTNIYREAPKVNTYTEVHCKEGILVLSRVVLLEHK